MSAIFVGLLLHDHRWLLVSSVPEIRMCDSGLGF